MTVLAATMGCAFLIVLASVGFGLHKTIEDDILSDENVTRIELMSGTELMQEDIEKIEAIDNVRNVRTITHVQATAHTTFEDRESDNILQLTNFKKYKEVNDQLTEGKFPTKPNEIIVGYHFAQYLLNDKERELLQEKSLQAEANGEYYDGSEEGYKDSVLGMKVNIALTPHIDRAEESSQQQFTIVGVLPAPAYEWAIDDKILMSNENRLLLSDMYMEGLPESFESEIVETDQFTDELAIFANQLEDVEAILQTLRDEGYQVYSMTEQLDEVNTVFSIVKIGLVFVGAIAVLIASIGIFNTMTMAVTERTREIGVMKAIGASPKLIQRLFLMESAIIGIIGVLLAVIISYIISFIANAAMPLIVSLAFGDEALGLDGMVLSYIPLELTLIAAGISLTVAIISGIRPARKATKIEVMQALRQEL